MGRGKRDEGMGRGKRDEGMGGGRGMRVWEGEEG